MADRPLQLTAAALPPAALLLASLFADDGVKGVFQADLAALVAATAAGGFLLRTRLPAPAILLAAALLCAPAHALVSGSFSGAPALVLLLLGVGLAVAGLAALGRSLGTPPLAAGAAGAAVLWIAMTGLLWADDLAEDLPRERRFEFRQAVLHLDAATACAYDAAGFDRFHDPRIYREVPLAASLVRSPSAGATGSAWLVVGLLAWSAAFALRPRRPSPPDDDGLS